MRLWEVKCWTNCAVKESNMSHIHANIHYAGYLEIKYQDFGSVLKTSNLNKKLFLEICSFWRKLRKTKNTILLRNVKYNTKIIKFIEKYNTLK